MAYVEEVSRTNLMRVERYIQKYLTKLAESGGGRYLSPTQKEEDEKCAATLRAGRLVFPTIDRDGLVWAMEGSMAPNLGNCKAFNETGLHGVIVFPIKEGERKGEKVRLYRGGAYKMGQPQVAPLARAEGVSVADLEAFRAGRVSLEDILAKVKDQELERNIEKVEEVM